MSSELISRSPDLQKLQHEGYEVEVRGGFLILLSIPYVNSKREVKIGMLVTDLTLSNDRTQRPGNHQVWFAGEQPCNQDGSVIVGIGCTSATQTLYENLEVHHRFSNKPPDGYLDYHAKMTRYVEIISNQAKAIDASVDARTFKPIEATHEDSVFYYTDSSSSRAGIAGLANKLAMDKVGIVGPGGSGSYVLDQLAKTHAHEIHLFDGDDFLQHNAFRAPGAVSIEVLREKPTKVAYYASVYSQMRRGIIPHEGYLDDKTVTQLSGFDFVFLCVDKASVRAMVAKFLIEHKIPFIDVGIDIELVEEQQCLIGACRATLCTPDKSEHFIRHVSTADFNIDELYRSNIQVADLNAMSAIMAVIKWKKYCGFYQDLYEEHQSVYVINTHQLTRDETIERKEDIEKEEESKLEQETEAG